MQTQADTGANRSDFIHMRGVARGAKPKNINTRRSRLSEVSEFDWTYWLMFLGIALAIAMTLT